MPRNYYSPDRELELAAARITKYGRKNFADMPKVIKAMAMAGKPAETQFNQYRIKYQTRDKLGTFKLHWIVSDGILGTQRVLYTKDFVGKTGKILWKKLAMAMRGIVS